MKKKTKKLLKWLIPTIISIILISALIFVIIIGGSRGWFQFNINVPTQNISLTPNTQTPTYNSCSQVCTQQGFSKYYTFIDSCKVGESKVTYGYQGQVSLLNCCCYNEIIPTYDCSENDNGDNPDVRGWCQDSFHNLGFIDNCEGGSGENKVLNEYYCDSDNICQIKTYNTQYCDDGTKIDTDPSSICYDGCYNLGYGQGKWLYDSLGLGQECSIRSFNACNFPIPGGLNKQETKTINGATCCCWCCNNNVVCH